MCPATPLLTHTHTHTHTHCQRLAGAGGGGACRTEGEGEHLPTVSHRPQPTPCTCLVSDTAVSMQKCDIWCSFAVCVPVWSLTFHCQRRNVTSGAGFTAPQATRLHPNSCFILEVLVNAPVVSWNFILGEHPDVVTGWISGGQSSLSLCLVNKETESQRANVTCSR